MSVDHGREPGGDRIEIEVGEIVDHVHPCPAQVEGGGQGELFGPRALVHVSADGVDRSHRLQGSEDSERPHVTRVDDAGAPRQRGQRLGAQQAVRIGDDSQVDRDRITLPC